MAQAAAGVRGGQPQGFFDVVARWACEAPENLACDDAGPRDAASPLPGQLTYAALRDAGLLLARALALRLAEAAADPAQGECAGLAVVATHMRRGSEWYAIFCAAASLGAGLVALSTDLPDKETEKARNADILKEHKPRILVVDGTGCQAAACTTEAACVVVSFEELWGQAQVAVPPGMPCRCGLVGPDTVLCFCYTGGTTEASRCVRITHGMALHEAASYGQVVAMGPSDRVLQQHSVYWAASAYGEIDIALAFGCAVVFCEAWGAEGVANTIRATRATCAGLVPSILAAVAPMDVPSLRVVFTWGEALPGQTAREWAHRVRLIDLLISTEYWLSLYADWTAFMTCPKGTFKEGDRPTFCTVPGTHVKLRALADADEEERGPVGAGELLVSGPMVTPGYTDPERTAAVLVEEEGRLWYCTRDYVEPRGNGLAFAGRVDDMIKIGGVWVDVRDVERQLQSVEGVVEARLIGQDAFAVLKHGCAVALPMMRRILPPNFQLALVTALPRRPGTEKVDRRALTKLTLPRNTAMEEDVSLQYERQLQSLARWYAPMVLLVAASILHPSFTLASDGAGNGNPGRGCCVLAMLAATTCIWEMWWRFLCVCYLLLAAWTFELRDEGSVKVVWMHRCFKEVPLGCLGAALLVASLVPGPLCGLLVSSPGLWCALRRRGGNDSGCARALAWPVVCAVGLPLWARDLGFWWPDYTAKQVAKWYLRQWCVKRPRSCWLGMKASAKLIPSALCTGLYRLALCGRWRRCGLCLKACALSQGRPESAGEGWYCNACWDLYEKHRECVKCKRWTTRGREQQHGWTCHRCEPLLPSAEACESSERSGDRLSPCLSSGTEGMAAAPNEHAVGRCRADCGEGGQPPLTLVESSSAPLQIQGSAPGVSRRRPEKKILLVQPLREQAELVTGCSAAAREQPSNTTAKPAEWALIERATGLSFASLEEEFALDSLRTTKMVSALRREAGVRLTRDTLLKCRTFGQVLEEVTKAPREAEPGSAGQPAKPSQSRGLTTHAAWGLMWRSRCAWTLHRDRPLSEEVLRQAMRELVQRHPALRAELADNLKVFTSVQEAFSVLTMWRDRCCPFRRRGPRHGSAAESPRTRFQTLLRTVARALDRLATWSFSHAWPRLRVREDIPVPLRVTQCASLEQARQALWRLPPFEPPFQVSLSQYGTSEEGGAFVHLVVTHMLSDGFTIVPLFADLAYLVSRAEAASAADADIPRPLPVLPSALAAFEDRLMRTIAGDSGMHDFISPQSIGKTPARDGITMLADIPGELVSQIRRAARDLTVAADIALLTILGTAIARFQGAPLASFALLAPQRDGPNEGDMVGLFADFRIITIDTGALTYAGTALQLQRLVKERVWHAASVTSQYDLPFVNFEWTDFQQRHGFSQVVDSYESNESCQNPFKVSVDQPDPESWRLRMTLDQKLYTPEDRERFFTLVQESFQHVAAGDLLAPVWPA